MYVTGYIGLCMSVIVIALLVDVMKCAVQTRDLLGHRDHLNSVTYSKAFHRTVDINWRKDNENINLGL